MTLAEIFSGLDFGGKTPQEIGFPGEFTYDPVFCVWKHKTHVIKINRWDRPTKTWVHDYEKPLYITDEQVYQAGWAELARGALVVEAYKKGHQARREA